MRAADQGEKLARSAGWQFSARLPAQAQCRSRAGSNALSRALLILIDNAVNYSPEGGVVNVTLETNQDFAVASVSDTGIGITPPEVPHIFDRFWRADKPRSREQGGAGLGLSIAKCVVEIDLASIDVESCHGKGSSFHVCVPLDHGRTPSANLQIG